MLWPSVSSRNIPQVSHSNTILGIARIFIKKNYIAKEEAERNAQQQEDPGVTVDTEMQSCEAYDIVRLSQQKVTMKDNPAYFDVSLVTTV